MKHRLIMLSDQGFFSIGNFLLTVILARFYTENELLSYGVGLSVALIIQGVMRNTYIIKNSIISELLVKSRLSKIIGQQTIIILTILSIQLIALIFLSSDIHSLPFLITLSTFLCSLIYFQLEFDRIIYIKINRKWDNFIWSSIFLVLNIGLLFLVPYLDISYFYLVAILLIYSTLKFLWLLFTSSLPNFKKGWILVKKDIRKNVIASSAGVLGSSGYIHFPLFILSYVSSPIQAAAFVAVRSLTQPMMIIIRSLDIVDKTHLHSEAQGDKNALRKVIFKQMAIYAALSIVSIVAVYFLGEFILSLVYGDKYAIFQNIFIGWILIASMLALSFPLESLIIKNNMLNKYNILRIISGLIACIASFPLCIEYGAAGAVISSLIGWIISILFAVYLNRKILFFLQKDKG